MTAEPDPIESHVVDGVLVIRIRAARARGILAERLMELVFDEFDGDTVVVNLSAVEMADSAVISALTRISDAKDLRVVGLREGAERVLRTMGVLDLLDIRANEEEALKGLASG